MRCDAERDGMRARLYFTPFLNSTVQYFYFFNSTVRYDMIRRMGLLVDGWVD